MRIIIYFSKPKIISDDKIFSLNYLWQKEHYSNDSKFESRNKIVTTEIQSNKLYLKFWKKA